jgi:ABC-type transport system involved in multi-copper enzyme maturation permease subunit
LIASFRAEFLKVRKRPATWLLLLIFVAIVGFAYFSSYAFANAPIGEVSEGTVEETAAQAPPPGAETTVEGAIPPSDPPPGEEVPPEVEEQMQAGQEAYNEAFLKSLYPENLVANMFSGGIFSIGGALALILGALVTGSEYGWGTLKTALTQRPGRLGTLFGKLLVFAVVILVIVLVGFAAAALSSFIIARLEEASVEWPSLSTFAEGFGAASLIFVVWGMLGFALATLFRGTALAIGLGLAWVLAVENLIAGLAGPNSDNKTLETIRKAMPGENTFALSNYFGSPLPEEFANPFQPLVEPERAVWVLAAYAVGFILISALLFWRRDAT